MTKNFFPIDPERVRQNAYLPVKLAELSKSNPEKALELLQAWGEGTKTIKKLWDEVIQYVGDTIQTSKEVQNENQSSRVAGITG
ncbi:hypothetical protein ABNX05_05050 [Lysinibacillus sp. M3]|uniref:Uncharacterized protein n=1 Tax=Lysinibacillus zambalensis TaxID=3160866 RepID=A0ABV1MN91_9BACI